MTRQQNLYKARDLGSSSRFGDGSIQHHRAPKLWCHAVKRKMLAVAPQITPVALSCTWPSHAATLMPEVLQTPHSHPIRHLHGNVHSLQNAGRDSTGCCVQHHTSLQSSAAQGPEGKSWGSCNKWARSGVVYGVAAGAPPPLLYSSVSAIGRPE